jgi:hypothetical protein
VAGSASASSITFHSSPTNVGAVSTAISLAKFDSTLGTLTGVRIQADFSHLVGSIDVTNDSVGAAFLSAYNNSLSVSNSAIGYYAVGDVIVTKGNIATTPDWHTTSIGSGLLQTFAVNAQSYSAGQLGNFTLDIASGYFGLYESVGGAGSVTLDATSAPSITTTGTSYTLDSSLAFANTQLAVIYTYAVPEPSTMVFTILLAGGMGLMVLRRRMLKA